MTRKDLISSPEYWIYEIQMQLFDIIKQYMESNNINRMQLAGKLGVTKGYVSQILNGDFDHRISKLVELSLAVNKVPRIEFDDLDQVLIDDELGNLHKPKHERPIIELKLDNELNNTLSNENNNAMTINCNSYLINESLLNYNSLSYEDEQIIS